MSYLKKFFYIVLLAVLSLFWRCAQIAPLTGGAKDAVAPKLLKAIPENGSVNFHSTTVELDFNEFVQVKDISNQLVVTPQTKELPFVEARGKKIMVKFSETLLPNTTYRLYFGQAISDMHESNTLSNFVYVFSTGQLIDSLSIKGQISNAFNLKPEENITVGLYPESEKDSVIYSQKPLYFTKTGNNGNYELNNLPHARYQLAAYSDKNKNNRYDGGEEMIGFAANIIETGSDSIVNARVYKEANNKQFIKKAYSPNYGLAYIIYQNEQLNNVKAVETEQKNVCSNYGINDTCIVYYNNVFDTLKLIIEHGAESKPDTVAITVLTKEKFEKMMTDKKLLLETAFTPQLNGSMPYYELPGLLFNSAIGNFSIDTAKIVFISRKDSVITRLPFDFQSASCNRLKSKQPLKQETEYELIIAKGTFKNSFGMENDSVKFSFKTNSPEDYASLIVKISLPGKENFMVQLISEKGELVAENYIEQSIASSTDYNCKFSNLPPAVYFVKTYEDNNKNRKWDAGRYIGKQPAENVYINPISVKLLANWDSEAEWRVK